MSNNTVILENDSANVARTELVAAEGTLQVAQSYVIDCPEMAEAAADDLGQIKAKLKQLDETRMGMTRPLDEAKKRIMELFERPRSVLLQAEAALKSSLLTWQTAERARMDAERKLAEEAARKAAEEARKEAEALAAAAAEAEAKGDILGAQETAQEAIAAAQVAESITHMAPVPVAAPAKLAGVSTREDWKAEVVDLLALVKAVAAGEASIELLEANQKVINQRAKALKGEFKVPGIRAYFTETMSARARA